MPRCTCTRPTPWPTTWERTASHPAMTHETVRTYDLVTPTPRCPGPHAPARRSRHPARPRAAPDRRLRAPRPDPAGGRVRADVADRQRHLRRPHAGRGHDVLTRLRDAAHDRGTLLLPPLRAGH